MRKNVLQKISIAILLCALSYVFASEPFAQSSIPIGKQQEAADDKPFAMNTSSQGPCDTVATIDNFLIGLMNNEASATGYINIYGQKDETVKNHVLLWHIKNQIKTRGIDASRIKITTGELRTVGTTEFWIVPAGKQPPPVVLAEWDYKPARNPQQINFCIQDKEDPTAEFLIEFLKYNPDFNGEVRIEETSVKRYRKIAKEAVAYLVKTGAASERLKTVHLKSQPRPNESYTIWLVPVSRSIGQMEIVYQFSNGPVSPEYQRNFTVTLNKANAKLRFQAYDKNQPTEITVKTGDAKFKEIMELAGEIEIRKDGIKKNEGCTGGSSESLKILDAKRTETFSGYVYHCGGTGYGNLIGNTKLLKAKIIALFPNEEYLK